MSDKSQKNSQPRKTGFITAIIFKVLSMLICGFCAWTALVGWFYGELLLKGQSAVTHAEQIATPLLQLLSDSSALLAGRIAQYFVTISQTLTHFDLPTLLLTVTQISLARLCIFIMTLPLMALILTAFITDGLVQRDIRKFQGARESTFFFHRTKNLATHSFLYFLFIYLWLPFSLSPVVLLLTFTLALGAVSRLSVTHFKKYL